MSVFWSAFLFGALNGLLLWMREYIYLGDDNAHQPLR